MQSGRCRLGSSFSRSETGRFIALIGMLIAFVGCSDGALAQGPRMSRKQEEVIPKGPSGPVEQQFPFGATWLLVDIDGKAGGSDTPSFTLDDKLRATGFGGCNTFSMALYPIKEQKLAAGAIATMKRSCGKPVDDLERNLLVGLHSLPKWHLEPNGDLTVKSASSTMHFRRGL